MLSEFYKRYLDINVPNSASHYITGINTINRILQTYHFAIDNIYSVSSLEDLQTVEKFLWANDEFCKKDKVGNKMYSNAFKHFCKFAVQDKDFFGQKITQMDIQIAKPQQVTNTSTVWKRNQILIDQALDGANHLCEENEKHQTFTARSTGQPYMEGHHLIPMKYQSQFNCGIDVYANIVCLCPICHRLLHHGTTKEQTITAEHLFELRQDRLIKSGIDISKQEFISIVL